MKQKRHTTEEILRIIREAASGKDLEAVLRNHNVSAASFYRWKKKFGRRTPNSSRCWLTACSRSASWKRSTQKNGEPFAQAASGPERGQSRTLLAAKGLSVSRPASLQPSPSTTAAFRMAAAFARPDRGTLQQVPAPGLPQARASAASRRLAGRSQARPAYPALARLAGHTVEQTSATARSLHRHHPNPGAESKPRLDLGLHQ